MTIVNEKLDKLIALLKLWRNMNASPEMIQTFNFPHMMMKAADDICLSVLEEDKPPN